MATRETAHRGMSAHTYTHLYMYMYVQCHVFSVRHVGNSDTTQMADALLHLCDQHADMNVLTRSQDTCTCTCTGVCVWRPSLPPISIPCSSLPPFSSVLSPYLSCSVVDNEHNSNHNECDNDDKCNCPQNNSNNCICERGREWQGDGTEGRDNIYACCICKCIINVDEILMYPGTTDECDVKHLGYVPSAQHQHM